MLAGNQSLIEELAKGSWGLYLNLYINYIEKSLGDTENRPSFESVIRGYLQKYFSANKPPKNRNQEL